MKKILNISFVAILAVVPMVAGAAGRTAEPVALGSEGKTQTVASTSYVQGAYNALGRQINNIISDSVVPNGAYKAIANDKNVAENLMALDSAIEGLSGGGEGSVANTVKTGSKDADYNSNGEYGENTIGKAIQDNSSLIQTNASNISANTGAIDVLNADAETAGSVKHAVAEEATRATTAETALGNRIGTLNADGKYIAKDDSVSTNLSALDVAVDVLNSDAETAGSVKHAVAIETTRATTAETALSDRIGTLNADGKYIAKDDSVSTNLSSLDVAVDVNTANIGSMSLLSKNKYLWAPESRTSLVSAINTLDEALSDISGDVNGSLVQTMRSEAQNGTYNDNTTYADDTIGKAIKDNSTAIAGLRSQTIDVATKWGNEANPKTINLFPKQ